VGSVERAGATTVLRGTASGVTTTGAVLFTQDSDGVPSTVERNDTFGSDLATGDFTGDGRDDLAIGASEETVGTLSGTGAVAVLKGSASGLTGTGAQQFTQGTGDLGSDPEEFDAFGGTLSAGDHNGDGRDDLAIGVPGESVGSTLSAGAVNVVYGTATGLSGTGSDLLVQGSGGIDTFAGARDLFGTALSALDGSVD
jgi:hypothetical protein